MKLTNNKLFSVILLFGLSTSLLVLLDVQYFYLRAIFSFIFLTTIPGLLIMLMLKIRKIEFWEYLVYTIGLSIAFLMFAGLVVNWILPWMHITGKPLSLTPLLISFNIILLIFGFIAYKRNKKISLKIKLQKVNWINKVFFAAPIIFPILSILGAITLNNDGPNYFTMIMLGGIASYIFLVVLFRNKLNKNLYPFAIFIISTSLLLMVPMRSWHIYGSDIYREYAVFQQTNLNSYWNISNLSENAYNACLSVTILPTIFNTFLKINSEYIFKFIFPIIFSFLPLSVYLFFKRYAQDMLAFIATFFFMSFPAFASTIPQHMRQCIAFLFFSLALLVLFNQNISKPLRKLFFLTFSFAIVVSHYSTSYIALGIFIFTYLFCFIYRKTENNNLFSRIYKKLNFNDDKRYSNKKAYYLEGVMVILLILFNFVWYSQLTQSSNNLILFTKVAISNMNKIWTEDVRSGSIYQQFNISYEPDLRLALWDYQKVIVSSYESKSDINLYNVRNYTDYRLQPVNSEVLPTKIDLRISSKISFVEELVKRLTRVFIIIGVIYFVFNKSQRRKINREYLIMTIGSFFCLAAIIVVPFASIEYNLDRTYQQLLILLSLPAVFGCLVICKFLKDKLRIIVVSIIFIIYFLSYTGFSSQIIGGINPTIQLNNLGDDYDKYFLHEVEVASSSWLTINRNKKNYVYASDYDASKMFTFGRYDKILKDVFPFTIDRNAYVYSGYTSEVKDKTFLHAKGNTIAYNFPTNFLNENKNLIYNNGGSKIFK